MDVDAIKTNLKRFVSNPNTMTFILVMGLIVVVYFVYNGLVSRAVAPVNLPYSTKLLTEETEITSEAIGTVKLSGNFVTSSGGALIQNRGQLLEKYVAAGYQIPENSFFYKNAITVETNTNKAVQYDIPDGYSIFYLDVNFHSTYGCSIMPGNSIDLFFKAIDDNQKVIYEKFIKSIRVERVIDKDGNNVFTHTAEDDEPKPSKLVFAVPEEYKKLLELSQLIRTNNIELIPVPHNAKYSENPEDTEIVNEAVRAFIESKSIPIND